MSEDNLMSIKDVMKFTGQSRVKIWKDTKAGLPHVRAGKRVLFFPDSVRAYYKSLEVSHAGK